MAEELPEVILRRLPKYRELAAGLEAEGWHHLTSQDIARATEIDALTVRKDLSIINVTGRRNYGYEVGELVRGIDRLLGWDKPHRIALVGEAKMMQTLLAVFPLARYNIQPECVVEGNTYEGPDRVGDIPIYRVDDFLARQKAGEPVKTVLFWVLIGRAQRAADKLVESGVKVFWNFSQNSVYVPEGVSVVEASLIGDLAVLSYEAMK